MLIVKSVGIPTILSVIDVQGSIGCGNNKIINVKSIVLLGHSQEEHQIGEDSTYKPQLPTILEVLNTGNANCVMPIVYGARIPLVIVSGVRITLHCWIYHKNAKIDSPAPNATITH